MIPDNNIPYAVTFLPWLRLQQSIATNGVLFWPFPDESKIFDPKSQFKNQLKRVFSGYIDPTGKPVHKLTVVSFQSDPFKNLTTEEAASLAGLVRLLAFSTMAENQYYWQRGPYFNSTHFQHMHQRFKLGSKYIAPQIRRRNGATLHGGYKHGELKFSIPLQTWGLDDAKPNTDLLRALAGLHPTTTDAVAIQNAISWFFLGNSDSESLSEQTEVALMGNAFEALFQVQEVRGKKAALMERLPKLFVGYLTKKTKKVGLDGTKGILRPWKVLWMDEFYWLRNKIVHGGEIVPARMIWDIKEHLTLAAITLQISIKLTLSNNGCYTLSSDDRVCADSIDHFMADGKLSEKKWLETKNKVQLNRAAQRAWATMFFPEEVIDYSSLNPSTTGCCAAQRAGK